MKKRFLSLALALALALALCAPAAAFDMYPDEEAIYEQLSSDAKNVYNVLNTPENLAHFRSGEDIVLTGFTGSYSSDNEKQANIQYCVDVVNDAYDAILLVHPEIFWLSGINLNLSWQETGSRFDLRITISFRFHDQWASGARSVYADEAAVKAAVQAIADEACVQGGPYQQLAYVHDWLTTHNIYHNAAAAAGAGSYWDYLPWTPLSALTDESQPVCEGYARAFKLICDELGYPCLFVVGTAINNGGSYGRHGWNMVQVAGKWYAVDCTFDDPFVSGVTSVVSGHEMQKYFMVGEETLIGDDQVFHDNHFEDGAIADGASFTYPALAPEGLDPGFTWGPPDIDEPDEPDYPDEPDEPQPLTFADVDEFAYYAPAVRWAVLRGVTNGTGADEMGNPLFSPGATVTRGQAVTFLWRAMWEPEPETEENPFADVSADAYYYDAVCWAVENGITNGMTADSFAPDAPVTRGQLLTFLWRTVGRPGETETYEGKQWYSDAEGWAAEFGILGDTMMDYSRDAACPRCDVVYYLYHADRSMAG